MMKLNPRAARIASLSLVLLGVACSDLNDPSEVPAEQADDSTDPAIEPNSEPSADGDATVLERIDAELWWPRRWRQRPPSTSADAAAPSTSVDAAPPSAPEPAPVPSPTPVVDASTPAPDAAAVAKDAGVPDSAAPPTSERDPFGVKKLYPTVAGGREWYLPANAETSSREWNVETNPVSRVGDGVFHTVGNNGETRLTVSSPAGQAWWRNVEMTGYFRYTEPHDSYDQERHWEFSARSDKHTGNSVIGNNINLGVPAPAGTVAWPGYPYGSQSVNGRCLGTSYHGNVYVAGHVLFEKEQSHTGGYAGPRGRVNGALNNPLQRWFGYKYVLRNADAGRRVHMELWIDQNATGDWKLVSQYDDVADAWIPNNAALDGCTGAPFNYRPGQLMTWAGPWITFRSDSIAIDFKSLSAREIAPL